MLFALLISVVPVNVPKGCAKGLAWTRHWDEGDQSDVVESKTVYKIPYDDYDYEYNAVVAKGSFCPQQSGTYVFSMSARPTGQVVVNGAETGDVGSSLICWKSTERSETVTVTLKAHMCYPFKSYLKSGCGWYEDHMRITITRNGASYNGDNDILTCNRYDCEDGFWGSDCKPCPDCHGNGYCSNGTAGTGKCICWTGSPNYGCLPTPVFTPSHVFTPSNDFTPSASAVFTASDHFIPSNNFTTSAEFTTSNNFITSVAFTTSDHFIASVAFTPSNDFITSHDFTPSNDFATSDNFISSAEFTTSNNFITSAAFTASTHFISSAVFTASNDFITSHDFTPSNDFSTSDNFISSAEFTTSNNFITSAAFTASTHFTPSNDFPASAAFTTSDDFSTSNAFSGSAAQTASNEFTSSNSLSNSEPFTYSSLHLVSGMFSASGNFASSNGFAASSLHQDSAVFGASSHFTASRELTASYNFTSSDVFPADNNASGLTKGQSGVIAGVSSVFAICLCGLLVWFFVFRKRTNRGEGPPNEAEMDECFDGTDHSSMVSCESLDALCLTSAFGQTQENGLMTAVIINEHACDYEEGLVGVLFE